MRGSKERSSDAFVANVLEAVGTVAWVFGMIGAAYGGLGVVEVHFDNANRIAIENLFGGSLREEVHAQMKLNYIPWVIMVIFGVMIAYEGWKTVTAIGHHSSLKIAPEPQ